MTKYKFEELRQALNNITVTDSSIALVSDNIKIYPIDFETKEIDFVEIVKEALIYFTKTIMDNPNFDLTNFKNNLDKKLIIAISLKDIDKDAGDTIYDYNKGLFQILTDYHLVETGTIFHELFHFASRPANSHSFPLGLREGYTEALTHRYFKKYKIAYPNNVYYALKLEEIVGKSTMEKAYSKGDISLLENLLDKNTLNIFNDNMNLILGSYYRINNNEALQDEEVRVLKAQNILDECLETFKKSKSKKI